MHESNKLKARLAQLKGQHLYRQRLCAEGMLAPRRLYNGKRLLSFANNDYLGLGGDARVIKALQTGAQQYGVGAGASCLINGWTKAHQALEEKLAHFTGRERALLFSTGYMANLGVLSALSDRHSLILQDHDNHASLIDAARLSRAKWYRYPHQDMQTLAQLLAEKAKPETPITIVASDAVFSMDGSCAPLKDMVKLCQQNRAYLMLDDAHGFGVLGESGGGSLQAAGLTEDEVPILIGTFGKACGTMGAFVAGSETLIETIIQHARTYIYTTAMPPAIASATETALDIIAKEPWRREHLHANIKLFRKHAQAMDLPLLDSSTAIQGLIVKTPERALALSQTLAQQGIQITAIRPPTVPTGTARLRITLSSQHQKEDIEQLIMSLQLALRQN